jgi:alkaline phosphatase D
MAGAASAAAMTIPMHGVALANEAGGPHQATGTRVGEVTQSSAIVWTRLTKHPQRNNDGVVFAGRVDRKNPQRVTVPVDQIEGACPGMPGRVRVRFGLQSDLSDATTTPWIDVDDASDFIHQFHLNRLRPDSTYHYVIEAAASGTELVRSEFRGRFSTAPLESTPGRFDFA